MWLPVQIDGCSLIVLEAKRSIVGGYSVVESVVLEHDGEELRLVSEKANRALCQSELSGMVPVTSQNRITACRLFDFFIVRETR